MEQITITLPTINQVEFSINCIPETIPVKGNVSAIDDETDKQNEDYVLSELESGNDWAWCVVEVTAAWKGLYKSAYLGCSSCKSEKDFVENSGYYEDMKQEAFNELIKELKVFQD